MVLSSQEISALIRGESPSIKPIYSDMPIGKGQIQAASFDFRLGQKVFCLRTASLPRRTESIADLIEKYCRYDFDLKKDGSGNVLERGLCYIIPLAESVSLFQDLKGKVSPKSSIGRSDVFCRVLIDRFPYYDTLRTNYSGNVYLELASQSWSVRVKSGISFTQGRLMHADSSILSNRNLEQLHAAHGIIRDKNGMPLPNSELAIEDGYVVFHVDIDRPIVGWRAKPAITSELRLFEEETHDVEEFFEPIRRPKNGELILEPGAFYLLATKERFVIPDTTCSQIDEYTVTAGELRVHYAGFFDPHFGKEENGKHGVLEVRVRDLPYRIVDNHPLGRMFFQEMSQLPDILYGTNSHYLGPNPQLPKFFKDYRNVWE